MRACSTIPDSSMPFCLVSSAPSFSACCAMASPQRIINRPRRVGDSDDHSAPSNAAVAAATASPTVSCDPKANRPHPAPVVGLWEGKLAPPECVSRPAIQCPYDIGPCMVSPCFASVMLHPLQKSIPRMSRLPLSQFNAVAFIVGAGKEQGQCSAGCSSHQVETRCNLAACRLDEVGGDEWRCSTKQHDRSVVANGNGTRPDRGGKHLRHIGKKWRSTGSNEDGHEGAPDHAGDRGIALCQQKKGRVGDDHECQ